MQYENTHIYLRCLDLLALARITVSTLPPGYSFLSDQLRRASSSTLLNFAEGYAKQGKDARRYFRIARGSASECAAVFDVASVFALIDAETHASATETCDHLARMLTRFRR